jgi:hypothetical protein
LAEGLVVTDTHDGSPAICALQQQQQQQEEEPEVRKEQTDVLFIVATADTAHETGLFCCQ